MNLEASPANAPSAHAASIPIKEGPAGGDPLGLAGAEEVADLLATALQRVEGGGLRRAVSPAEDAACLLYTSRCV